MEKRIYRIIAVLLTVLSVCVIFSACAKESSGPDLTRSTSADKSTEETTSRYATVTRAETETEKSGASGDAVEAGEGQTNAPVITGTVNTAPDQICIAGTCDPNSVVYIKGGVTDVQYNADGRYFIGTAYIPKAGSTTLYVTAKSGDLTESPSVAVESSYKASATHIRTDAFEVVVGSNYQCHFVSALADFEGTNLLTSSQKTNLTKNITGYTNFLENEMDGAELIYLIVPNPMTIYPETVPDEYTQNTGESRTDQFQQCAEEGGAVVINLTDAFFEHKNDRYKLFNKTDSHWTEYGAWVGYTELMNYISQKYPSATPRTEEEMGFYKKDFGGGDMPYYLELDPSLVREIAVFTKYTFTSPANMNYYSTAYGYDTLLMNFDTTPPAATYNTGDSSLPNAYVMRDSFGIQIYNELCERFNKTVYKAMWSYGFDESDIKKSGANYVIYIIAERNLGDLLY